MTSYGKRSFYSCRTRTREMGRWRRELQNGSFCIINKTWPIWIAVFVCQPDYLISDTPSRPPLLILPPFFCTPAAIACPCKYVMTKIGNSCIRLYNNEGRKKNCDVRGYLRPKTVGLTADNSVEEIIATSNMSAKSKWALHKVYTSFFILFFPFRR